MPPPLGMAASLGLGVPRQATSGGGGGGGGGPFNVGTIDTTANLEARTGDPEGFIAFDKTTGQLYVQFGDNFWNKTNSS